MIRDQLVEKVAQELRSYESCKHSAEYGGCAFTNCSCEHKAKTLISRLGDFIPGLADVIAGRAVVMPIEPTEEMTQAAGHLAKGCRRDCTIGVHSAREVYRAMIQAGKAGE